MEGAGRKPGTFLFVVISLIAPVLFRSKCILFTAVIMLAVIKVFAEPPHRSPLQLRPAGAGLFGFQRVPGSVSGITFAHQIAPARSLTNQMLLDGSGVALADYDGDARVDIFFAATDGKGQLWRNLGEWRFEEQTQRAFPSDALAGDITGVVFADLNGDRTPDLVLNSHADGIRIFTNTGHGTFERLGFKQARARGGHSLSLADADGDGWLDIYVCNYRQRALMDMPSARATFQTVSGVPRVATFNGRPTTESDLTNRFSISPTGELEELGEPDVLYRNLGGTNFSEVSWTSGSFRDENGDALKLPPMDWGLASQFCDVNGDGRPDLYVCNDFHSPDRLWLNESSTGQVRFRLAPRDALRHTSAFSMGVDFADINRDGRWDFVVVDMLSPDHVRRLTSMGGTSPSLDTLLDPGSRPQFSANSLFLQRSDSSFAEIGNFAGITATDWSWTPLFLDVDLDGWPDLLVSAGQERGSRDLDIAEHMKAFRRGGLRTDAQIFRERQKFLRQSAPLKAFRNQGLARTGDIPRFTDMSGAWGFDYDGVSHGMALADLDGDGDLDVVINHLHAAAGLFENLATAPRIAFRLKGISANTEAIGAELRFTWVQSGTNCLPQAAQISVGGRYLSSDDFLKTFACGASGDGSLHVRWPSGRLSTVTNLTPNYLYEIEEGAVDSKPVASIQPPIARRLHFEARVLDGPATRRQVIDFTAQPSLPRLQSTRGPGLAVTNPRGESELWVGRPGESLRSGKMSSPALRPVDALKSIRSVAAMIVRRDDLLVATDAWQLGGRSASQLFLVNGTSRTEHAIKTTVASISTLALDSSGSNLFVGGGPLFGKYPLSANSEMLRWDGKDFASIASTNRGLITCAAFGDLDDRPGQELITVTEWGYPQIFHGDSGFVRNWNAPVRFGTSNATTLEQLVGWWQSVAVADLDGDGRNDLVMGNWGLNSAYSVYTGAPSPEALEVRPLSLFHGDFQGSPVCLEGYTSAEGRTLPIQGLTEVGRYLPWSSELFRTHRSYASADIAQVLGDKVNAAQRVECRYLSSMVLFNRGDHFAAVALPDLAQLGPIFAIKAADFDKDGYIDLFCAQGYFGQNFGMTRGDGGEGIFLMGTKGGEFEPIATSEAGFRLPGQQGSVLATDLDEDGRPDLVVGEYGGPVTVLLNRKP